MIGFGTPPRIPRRKTNRPCRADGCDRWAKSNGLCGKHIQRLWKHGSVEISLANREHDGSCSVIGCDRRYYASEYCKRHYERARAHGSPTLADEMAARQNGVCAVCGQAPRGRGHESRLHLDHDHATGAWRGMLCGPCNKALGLLGDDPAVLRAAADYIDEWRGAKP